MKTTISVLNKHKTIVFAAEELKKYILMMNNAVSVETSPDEYGDITLDLLEETSFDIDTVSVDIKGLKGTIKGSNPRSVLFAVYKYLEKLGARWLRHGDHGEYIPKGHNFDGDVVSFTETAKYKHRCMMSEGAMSLELFLANIDWCAKVGFNEYYVQGLTPKFMFDRWYKHRGNPLLEKVELSDEQMQEYKDRMEEEIKKRDLIYYTLGHGWHSEPFGISSLVGTINENLVIPDELKDLIALVNGKREVIGGRMSDTQLCYSNQRARKKIVDFTVQFCKDHPQMDYIFFPLADGINTHCECENCCKKTASDWYVTLLNELDAALEKEGLPAKIIIPLYCDMLWPPTEGKFNNPDRMIYTFAPMQRYLYNYKPSKRPPNVKYKDLGKLFTKDELPPYVRNKLTAPRTAEEFLSFLKAWQDWQDCDSFSHEYYNYVGEQYFDFGSVEYAEIIYDDIREFPKYKLNGMLTCGTQRTFMPTGLGMWAMAKGLWNDEPEFETVKKEYFDAAFGSESKTFSDYFTYLSKLAHTLPEVPFDTVIETCTKMKEYIGTLDLDAMDECHSASIKYVLFHCDLIIKQMLAEKITTENGGNQVPAEKEYKDLFHYVRENEMSVYYGFDQFVYFHSLGTRSQPATKIYHEWWWDWDESDR